MTSIYDTDPNPHTAAARPSCPALLAAVLTSGVITFATLGAVLFGATPSPTTYVVLAGPMVHPIPPGLPGMAP